MSSTAIVPTPSQDLVHTNTSRTATQPLVSQSASTTLPISLTPQKKTTTTPVTTGSATKPFGHGGWIHPRMDEVIRRRNNTNFDASNTKAILTSTAIILATIFVPSLMRLTLPASWLHAIRPWPVYILWLIRLAFIASIGLSAAPLFRTPDACEDIPLTPSQRQLLGLPPMSRPATPQEKEQYVTPPRFSRSNTPRSSPSSLRAQVSGSPLSGRGTPMDNSVFRVSGSGSPFGAQQQGSQSPLGLSTLRDGSERRRLSYTSNRSSPLSFSEFESIGNTGTPTKSNKASIGLNNKWLYEKGKGSPKGLFASRGPSFI